MGGEARDAEPADRTVDRDSTSSMVVVPDFGGAAPASVDVVRVDIEVGEKRRDCTHPRWVRVPDVGEVSVQVGVEVDFDCLGVTVAGNSNESHCGVSKRNFPDSSRPSCGALLHAWTPLVVGRSHGSKTCAAEVTVCLGLTRNARPEAGGPPHPCPSRRQYEKGNARLSPNACSSSCGSRQRSAARRSTGRSSKSGVWESQLKGPSAREDDAPISA